jgi:DNA polymerase-1
MIAVDRRLREEGLDAHLVLQVHDELILEAHKKDADRAAEILREAMEGAAALSVPLTVEVTIGTCWLD